MKVALVFHGLSEGYNNKGILTSINKESFKNIKDNLIDSNSSCNFDIFFHTWENKRLNDILDFLKPKKYLVEKSFNNSPKL